MIVGNTDQNFSNTSKVKFIIEVVNINDDS